MRSVVFLCLFFLCSYSIKSQNKEIKNAFWFNGKAFQEGNIYIKDGKFSFSKPEIIHETIDLSGKFIVPPYGETHTHNLSSNYGVESMIAKYENEGILYVQVLGGSSKGRQSVQDKVDDSILDVVYSNGGITCTLGHPFTIYEPLAMGIHNPAEKRNRAKEIRESRLAENDAYWFFDSKEDVDNKWNDLLNTEPDIIKIMLLHSDKFDSLLNENKQLGGKGISPQVAKYVVQKAKVQQLSVFAHVETAFDFRTAVEIGVDVVAHLPGYAWNGIEDDLAEYEISDADLSNAEKKGIAIISTASLSKQYAREYINGKPEIDEARLDNIISHQKVLMERILDSGITLSIGSDQYGKTLFTEVAYLNEHRILDPLTIVNIICTINPQLIFPDRKIGQIDNGFEANFLVLNGNPIDNLSNLESIDAIYLGGEPVH